MSTVLQDADRKLLCCCCKAHVKCRRKVCKGMAIVSRRSSVARRILKNALEAHVAYSAAVAEPLLYRRRCVCRLKYGG